MALWGNNRLQLFEDLWMTSAVWCGWSGSRGFSKNVGSVTKMSSKCSKKQFANSWYQRAIQYMEVNLHNVGLSKQSRYSFLTHKHKNRSMKICKRTFCIIASYHRFIMTRRLPSFGSAWSQPAEVDPWKPDSYVWMEHQVHEHLNNKKSWLDSATYVMYLWYSWLMAFFESFNPWFPNVNKTQLRQPTT